MHENEEDLDCPVLPGSKPDSPAERAIRELRRECRLTWEELKPLPFVRGSFVGTPHP